MTSTTILLALFANGLFGIIATPFYIRYARRNKIVDVPNHRSSHTTITPRGGGIFLAFGSLLFGCLYLLSIEQTNNAWAFLAISFGIALLGLIDDLRALPSILRLGIQLGLTATLFLLLHTNLQFTIFNFQLANHTWLAMGVFTIWIVACLNIYNFMDGIDGIATLQGIATAAGWSIIAYSSQNEFALLFALLLLGGLLAFLRYNWSPAKVFMGDCSSSFLGFAFAALPLLHSQHTGTNLWVAINLSALMLFPFLFDGAFTILRKISKRENILKAHRSHLYQRWAQLTDSHRLVSIMYGLWAVMGSITSVLVYSSKIDLTLAYAAVLAPGIALIIYSRQFSEE
jgi:Fuc2NAc and GlcNAc transferase